MKFQMIDLGRPKSKDWVKAFIHSPKGDFLVKSDDYTVSSYLKKFGPYFGKMVHYRNRIEFIAGGGLKIKVEETRKRPYNWNDLRHSYPHRRYYAFYDAKYNILLLKTRRFPNKWIDLQFSLDDQILVATDYLKGNGFEFAAQVLMRAYHEANKVE